MLARGAHQIESDAGAPTTPLEIDWLSETDSVELNPRGREERNRQQQEDLRESTHLPA